MTRRSTGLDYFSNATTALNISHEENRRLAREVAQLRIDLDITQHQVDQLRQRYQPAPVMEPMEPTVQDIAAFAARLRAEAAKQQETPDE
jgi:hypothetical protein